MTGTGYRRRGEVVRYGRAQLDLVSYHLINQHIRPDLPLIETGKKQGLYYRESTRDVQKENTKGDQEEILVQETRSPGVRLHL